MPSRTTRREADAVKTAKRFFDARLSRVSTPHDAHRLTRTPSSCTMSRAAHDDRVHALFDVPGTGFRDREGTGMFTQYHKMGWQSSAERRLCPRTSTT